MTTELLAGQTITSGSTGTWGAGGPLTPVNPTNVNDRSIASYSSRPSIIVTGPSGTYWWAVNFGAPTEVGSWAVLDVGQPTVVWRTTSTASPVLSLLIERSADGSSWTSESYTVSTATVGGYTEYTYTLDTPATYQYWRIRKTIQGGVFRAADAMREWYAYSPVPPVVAAFSGTPLSGIAPLEVEFTDESTGGPTSWDWDFGDGDTSTDQNPTHIYTGPGVYTVTLSIDSGDSDLTRVNYITVTTPAVVIGDPGEFVVLPASDIVNWKITRSGPPAGTGGGYSGAATVLLNNTDNRYNPENEASDIIDKLRDGTRIWIGVNDDGTITPDEAKTVRGLFGGRITEITVLPSPGAPVPSQVEFVCEDPLSWIDRTAVTIAASRHRSQQELRSDILTAANELSVELEVEPTTMPLSYADGKAGNLLDDINRANGTRHFADPADDPDTWYHYATVRRTSKLDGAADASIDAGSDHLTDTSGWKKSAESVINQQRATVEPVFFTSYQTTVWETEDVPFAADSRPEIWVEFDDYVERPVVALNYTGSTVTAEIDDFGLTAKITLTGTGTVTSLEVQGSLTKRGVAESVVIDDDASQDATRGVRAGSDISGDFVGTIRGAHGIASHVVWRYADPLYSPEFVVQNWFPTQFTLDLYDTIAVTTSHIGVEARIFEIIGITHEGNLAAEEAQHHVVRYQTLESRVQTAKDWFTLDVSELDDTHVLAY